MEKFYWLVSNYQNKVWGIVMMDVLAVTDELTAAGRSTEAFTFLRQSAPLYLSQAHLCNYKIPAEQMPSKEEMHDAWSVLALSLEEAKANMLWDDLYHFNETCTISPKAGWLSRWHKLGGKDFWDIY
ncbi:MAG: hypothetical protein IJJ26_00515 [Victivallales bacterium]|nr:hypothetical protein [Victivallales bacterium]